jgi:hypothetical protein
MRVKGLLVVAALAASLAVASVALAAAARTDTSFKMKDRGDHVEYSGKVTSDPPRQTCIAGRKVKIFHRGILIAETRTDSNGSWAVDGPRPPEGDEVTAKVVKKKKGGRTICRGKSVTDVF